MIRLAERNIKPEGIVAFSFDDGREDNYRLALPIMNEFGIKSTINITTGYIDGTHVPLDWPSTAGPLTIAQILEMNAQGHEMASHGDKHLNTEADFNTSVDKLLSWGVDNVYGFASPGSGLTFKTRKDMSKWLKAKGLTYARSGMIPGTQVIDNKNNIPFSPRHPHDPYCLPSHAVMKHHTVEDIKVVVNNAKAENKIAIIMLHSILNPGDFGYGADNWYWDATKFRDLCSWLSLNATVLPVHEAIRRMRGL